MDLNRCRCRNSEGGSASPPRSSLRAPSHADSSGCHAAKAWERDLGAEGGLRLDSSLTVADLVGLAVLREAAWRLGDRVSTFNYGLSQLFQVLRAWPDIERLDGCAMLIGPNFARVAALRKVHLRCARDDFVVVPLRPILADFLGQAFA